MAFIIRPAILLALALAGLAVGPIGAAPLTQKESDLFLARALDLNASQLDLAEKAAAKASKADVKKFANELVDDHKKLNKDLIILASDSKIAVVSGLSKEHREAVIKMLALSGEDFDRAFLRNTIRLHDDAIKLYETDGVKQSSNRIRSFAEQTLPAMRKHLKQANALAGES